MSARFPSPFASAPHPLARSAAETLMRELADPHCVALRRGLDAPGSGKMFGVLVARAADGSTHELRAFSGMLGGAWFVEGFAPPVFDAAARDAFWPAGEAELDALAGELAAIDRAAAPIRDELAALDARHAAGTDEIRARHLANRSRRRSRRELAGGDAALLHALDQESRGDAAERRRFDAACVAERAAIADRLAILDAQHADLDARRAARSRELFARIHELYVFANARGERRSLRELFDGLAPGGAGDCAAPKLLAEAYRRGLTPLALAEFWWGAPPLAGGRHGGQFYPACRGKCGPILAHMLDGLDVEPAPVYGAVPAPADQPRVVFEDAWLLVVDKPAGMLSVPGKTPQLHDSALVRLRARIPGATVVHRLDLDTSGLLLVAKDPATHAALQRMFATRAIDKRYIAWLAGDVRDTGETGSIDLALRVDLDDRPRQIHDPIHGKPALTEWRILARASGRSPGRTRVALVPRTGRTHQLRVHAAHPLGLAAPVVGDRLYGEPGDRLLLHAEALDFVHPHTHERVHVELPAPF